MADELKPCPFCGSAAERVDIDRTYDDMTETWDELNAGGSFIHCTRCEASTAIVFDRKETLFSSWNNRFEDWHQREVETQSALQEIGEEFGFFGGEPRVDAVRRVLTHLRNERDRLQAENKALRDALEKFKHLADTTDHAPAGASISINVNMARNARDTLAALASQQDGGTR